MRSKEVHFHADIRFSVANNMGQRTYGVITLKGPFLRNETVQSTMSDQNEIFKIYIPSVEDKESFF